MKPILNSTLYLALFFLGLTVLVGLIQLLAGEKGREKLREISLMDIGKYWFGCLFTALSIFTVFLFVTYTFNSDDANGYLADHVPFIGKLQEKWHMVEKHLEDIKAGVQETAENTREMKQDVKANVEQTQKVVEHTKATEEHARTTAENTGELVKLGKEQVEITREIANPKDIQKQLAQKGYPFTIEGYASQVMAGNLDILKMYYEAGWDPATPGANGFPPIFEALIGRSPNCREVVEQAVEEGKYDLNRAYSHNYLSMNSLGQHVLEVASWIIGYDSINPEVVPMFSAGPGRGTDIPTINPLNIGSIIAMFYKTPDSGICELIGKLHIDMTKGVKWRQSLAKSCANAGNPETSAMGQRMKQQISQFKASLPPQLKNNPQLLEQVERQRKEAYRQALANLPDPIANRKLYKQRLAEFRKGTEMLAKAAQVEGKAQAPGK